MLHQDIELKVTGADHEWHPRYIDVIATLYIFTLTATWVIAGKLFTVGGLVFSASIFTYPLMCIFGDVLTEIYGFNRTRRLIWMGFVCGILFLLFTQLAIVLPPAADYKLQEAFAAVHNSLPRIVLGGWIAYVLCEFTNSWVMSKMKIWSNARNFSVRAIASTAAGQLVDSLAFFTLAFAGVVPTGVLVNMILSGWILKTAYEALFLPATTLVVRWIKKLEGVEHFDRYKLKVLKF